MKIELTLSRKKFWATILVLSILASTLLLFQYGNALTGLPPWNLSAPRSQSFDWYVGQYTNGSFYCESGDWQIWYNSNDANITFRYVLDSGNTVYISNGNYSNTDLGVLPNHLILTLDANATGINYLASNGDYIVDNAKGRLFWNGTDQTLLFTDINGVIGSAPLTWSKITNADSIVNSLISSYLLSNPIAYSSLTGLPSGVGEYSYLIGEFGNGTYYAINGTTNKYVTSWCSTNASYVENSVSQAVTYGTIVSVGNISLSSPIIVNTGNKYIGGIFVSSANSNCPLFQVGSSNIQFQNMILDGQQYLQSSGVAAINITVPVSNILVNDVDFYNCWQAGIKGDGGYPAVKIIVNGLTVTNCNGYNFQNGIDHMGGLVYVNGGENIIVQNWAVSNFGTISGVILDGVKIVRSSNVQIIDNTINNITGHSIFVGFGSQNVNVAHTNCINNMNGLFSLEAICIEYGWDENDISAPNQQITVTDTNMQMSGSNGNNGIYISDTTGLALTGFSMSVTKDQISNPYLTLNYVNNSQISNLAFSGLIGDESYMMRVAYCNNIHFSMASFSDSPNYYKFNAPYVGLSVAFSNQLTFDKFTLSNLTTAGIEVEDSDAISILNSNILNVGTNGTIVWSITIGTSTNVRLINDVMISNTSNVRGVYLSGVCDNILVQGTTFGVTGLQYYYDNLPTHLAIIDCPGYVVGAVNNPVQGSLLADSYYGGSGPIISGVTYIDSGCPAVIYDNYAGTCGATLIYLNGNALLPTFPILLQPGDTIQIFFTNSENPPTVYKQGISEPFG